MKRVLSLAVAGLFCAGLALAQDPVQVDPKHHKVEFEDNQVRVLRITFGPGEKAPSHEHPAGVAVYLTDASDLKLNATAGQTTPSGSRTAGRVLWAEPTTHAPENTGNTPIEVILVEFKPKPAVTKAAAKENQDDSTKVDPKHYKTEVDNDRVRVIRARYGPGEKSVMHQHPALVAVFLTDGNFKFTMPDGTSREVPIQRGGVMADAAQQHLPQNLTQKPAEVILVEPK